MNPIDDFLDNLLSLPFIDSAQKIKTWNKCALIRYEFNPQSPVRIGYYKIDWPFGEFTVEYPDLFIRTYLEEWEAFLDFLLNAENVSWRHIKKPVKIMTILNMMTKMPVIEGDNHGILEVCERI